jgi:hypothetical protein
MRALKVSAATVWVVALAALAVAVVLLASCADLDFSPHIPPVAPTVERDTPNHLLEFFCQALEGRLIDAYSAALADSYRFTFMSVDWEAAGVIGSYPYWGKTADVASTSNLFGSDKLISITCDLAEVLPWYADTVGFVMIGDVDLRVKMSREADTITYWVNESWLEIAVKIDPIDQDLWVIRGIEESTAPYKCTRRLREAGSATERSTFGSIKAMFRQVPG